MSNTANAGTNDTLGRHSKTSHVEERLNETRAISDETRPLLEVSSNIAAVRELGEPKQRPMDALQDSAERSGCPRDVLNQPKMTDFAGTA